MTVQEAERAFREAWGIRVEILTGTDHRRARDTARLDSVGFETRQGPLMNPRHAPSDKPSVFISYRRTNEGSLTAQLLIDLLKYHQVEAFLDVADLDGGQFGPKIQRAIEAKNRFVLVCTPGVFDRCSENDDWVRKELEVAIRAKIRIIPFLIPPFVLPPPDSLPESIRSVLAFQAWPFDHLTWQSMKGEFLRKMIGFVPPPPGSAVAGRDS